MSFIYLKMSYREKTSKTPASVSLQPTASDVLSSQDVERCPSSGRASTKFSQANVT